MRCSECFHNLRETWVWCCLLRILIDPGLGSGATRRFDGVFGDELKVERGRVDSRSSELDSSPEIEPHFLSSTGLQGRPEQSRVPETEKGLASRGRGAQ